VSQPHTLEDWQRPEYAQSWHAQDSLRDLLAFPRRMSAALIGHDTTPARVIDVGSGPGAFLEVYLEAFPQAQGVWTDASEAMRDIAPEALSRFGDRVEYHIAEMTELSGVPGAADVLLTSRASHHLDAAGLARFYNEAAGRLRPGGWIVNLDHFRPEAGWDKRYRAVRPQFTGARPQQREGHVHTAPSPSLAEHYTSLAETGYVDVDIAWKSFGTVLLMGRTRA
jgi:SAM-dependent methyltransferase